MNKQIVYDFLQKNEHAVIATSSIHTNQPESALIGFGQTEELEIIFGTFNTSRKYHNLRENNKVSFVIGWENDFITVQYEGIAQEITESDEKEQLLQIYHKKVPSAEHYSTYPEQSYFKVTPTWIRYSDLSGEEEKIVEITF